jgi:hypothetical protein
MSDYSPPYADTITPFTMTASATITGGTLLESTTTGAVGPAGAASIKVVGVAAHDAVTGQRVSVWPLDSIVHEITTTAGGTVGDILVAAAAGQIATNNTAGVAAAAGTLVGIALTTAGAAAKQRFIGR